MVVVLLIAAGLGALAVMVSAVASAANRGPGWARRRAAYAPGTEDGVPWVQGSDSGSEHRHDAGGAGSGHHHAAHHHAGGGFDAGHHHTSHDSGSFSDSSSFDFGGGHHH